MENVFLQLVRMSISASWIVLAVIFLRVLLKKGPKWINPILWGIVGVRLLIPFSIKSPVSLIPRNSISYVEAVFSQTVPAQAADAMTHPLSAPSILPIVSMVWMAGVICILTYTLVSCMRLNRQINTAVLLRENIFQSEHVKSAFVFGLVRPRIYLPFAISEKESQAMIAHEKAHIARGDHLTKQLAFLLAAVYWFNPMLWIAFALFCRDIEFACDEKVIRELDREQRACYSETLLARSSTCRAVFACPLFFGEVGIKSRVEKILNYKAPTRRLIAVAIGSCLALAVCFLTEPVYAQSDRFTSPGVSEGISYYLTIPVENVALLNISTPYGSGGCVPGGSGVFPAGQAVWIELLEDCDDLSGVTISAYDKDGAILFTASTGENTDSSEKLTDWSSQGWTIGRDSILP